MLWLACVCGVILGLSGSGPAQEPRLPRLVLSQDSWDFGEVWHPESAKLTLMIKNEGSADLKIEQVRSTCGCTVAQPARDLIPPGQTTEMLIRFDTVGKQDHVSSKVIIESNDPLRPKVEFNVSGFVRRAIKRTPLGGLVIRSLERGPGLSGVARLENQTSEPMQLRLVSNGLPGLDVEIQEVVPGLTYDIVGRTNRPMPPGTTRGDLVFSTGLQREPRFTLSAAVRILSLVEASPPAIYMDLKTRELARPSERLVNIHYYGSGAFSITGVECPDPNIKVSYGATEPPGELGKLTPPVRAVVRARVSLPPASAIPREGVKIVFNTSVPDHPKCEVLVTTDQKAWEETIKGPQEGASDN